MFGVPLVHVLGHRRECRVLYDPLHVSRLGLTDLENSERVNEYLGRFADIIRSMRQVCSVLVCLISFLKSCFGLVLSALVILWRKLHVN